MTPTGTRPNFRNRTLYHGDNLDFLRGMNSETVHLIATDPPFNKNRDFHATPDSLARGARFRDRWRWEEDVHEEWTDGIIDDWPAVWEVITSARAAWGDDMGAFLCWLGVRLMEMHRVLRADGSLYLHIDHTAHGYVKCLLDGIFGWKNFQNEIVWYYSGGGASKRRFARKHDTLLFYSKSQQWTFNVDAIRVPHKWVSGQRRADGSERDYKKGKLPDDVIELHSIMPWAKERTGYPTQKPLALYRRIIEASSNEGDIVLDPFCGCATTPVAAEQLKRQWVGMDIWDGAKDIVLERLQKEWLFTPEASESKKIMFPHEVTIKNTPPVRSDDNAIAAPALKLRIQRPREAWQRLSHRQMTNALAAAQASGEGVICAGCGRVLEREFMQLDHIQPKAEGGANHILNRILLCGPCNRRKRNYLTLAGLLRENKRKAVGWMQDESRALLAQDSARARAEWVRDHFDTPECQALVRGRSNPS
ncbi:MAG: DNA methyltransferase [Anaerolineaceae bacterium]|nr:DNA methyltransferase [Anaerolineaceae bacterium]